jgi:hypothetical protein
MAAVPKITIGNTTTNLYSGEWIKSSRRHLNPSEPDGRGQGWFNIKTHEFRTFEEYDAIGAHNTAERLSQSRALEPVEESRSVNARAKEF